MDLPTWRPGRGIPETPPPPPSSPQNLVLTPSAEDRRNDSLPAGYLPASGKRCLASASTTEKCTLRPGADSSSVPGFRQHDSHNPPAAPSSPGSPLPSKRAPVPATTSHFSRTLVLDTGAFLRLKRLDQFGRDFVVPPSVLGEIRDARARAHIAGVTWLHPECELPTVMAASEEDKRWARKFASMTGDLGVLSGTDLDVIALTYMLQRRTGRVEKLRTKPLEPIVVRETSAPTETWNSGWWGCSKSSESGGDTFAGKGETGDGSVYDSNAEDQDTSIVGTAEDKRSMLTEGEKEREEQDTPHEKRECAGVGETDDISAEETIELSSGKDKAPPSDEGSVAVAAGSIVGEGVAETREIVEVVGDDDDREGVWITSENLSRFKREVEGVSAGRKEEALVACMTTDYSVQNVLLQMGLDVVTIDGLAVRSVKSWALICRYVCRLLPVGFASLPRIFSVLCRVRQRTHCTLHEQGSYSWCERVRGPYG